MRNSDLTLTRLPSIKGMLAFNIVARHLNLVRAAGEMGITQGALSRQIKALEDHLGVRLFERQARGLCFTQDGELLYDFTRNAFETLGVGIGKLTRHRERQTLVLSVARSFGLRVLIPRLVAFSTEHPNINISFDIHRYHSDLTSSGADFSIRLGSGNWKDCKVARLTNDTLFPVCTPALAAIVKNTRMSSTVARLRNIERDYWTIWDDATNSEEIFSGGHVDFNDSASMLQAAEAGMGIAISRSSLCANALKAGLLVRPCEEEFRDDLDYYAVATERTLQKPAARLFDAWLAREFPT